jgi:hypothetical protein
MDLDFFNTPKDKKVLWQPRRACPAMRGVEFCHQTEGFQPQWGEMFVDKWLSPGSKVQGTGIFKRNK